MNENYKKQSWIALIFVLGFGAIIAGSFAQTKKNPVVANPLDSLVGLEVVNGNAEIKNYQGRQAVHLLPLTHIQVVDDAVLAIVRGTDFKDGTIEVEVAGAPRTGAPADSRGFIGIMFRAQDHSSKGENFYLRPTNGRADDQLRRNHAVQYESLPDFPGTGSGKKILAYMSPTSIWRRASGRR